MTSGTTITIDPDGDLVLLLGPPGEDSTTRILASSKHMALSSRIFRAMLHGNFQEGTELKETGKLELPLPDDNPDAMLILINIVHNRPKFVPLEVNLEKLTEIAILVDKYEMHESLHILLPIWMKALPGLTSTSTPSPQVIIQWLCVSWVFGRDNDFTTVTKYIQLQATESLEQIFQGFKLDQLPIPQIVIDCVDMNRQSLIQDAVSTLKCEILKYERSTSKPICSAYDQAGNDEDDHRPTSSERACCDTMVLGSLIRNASSLGIYPLPTAPYDTWSFDNFETCIRSFEIATLCSHLKDPDGYTDGHSVRDRLVEGLQSIKDGYGGLKLEDFKAEIQK